MEALITDQMKRTITVPFPPKRIISLVPSQTELLYYLGLSDEVVGQTLFCIHPADMHSAKPRIGGTKKLNMQKIEALEPDLLIGNMEENERTQIDELSAKYPVWMSDIRNLEDALDMIERVGALVNRKTSANDLAKEIRHRFSSLEKNRRPIRTAYLIWRDPWMAAGHDTFINDMMKRCGMVNIMENHESRYPVADEEQLRKAELILLSSEPFPFAQKHLDEMALLCPHARVLPADGELFSWYGNRLLRSADYFTALLAQIGES